MRRRVRLNGPATAEEERVHLDLIEIVKWRAMSACSSSSSRRRIVVRFFLPGDSLLITAGVLATDKFPDHSSRWSS